MEKVLFAAVSEDGCCGNTVVDYLFEQKADAERFAETMGCEVEEFTVHASIAMEPRTSYRFHDYVPTFNPGEPPSRARPSTVFPGINGPATDGPRVTIKPSWAGPPSNPRPRHVNVDGYDEQAVRQAFQDAAALAKGMPVEVLHEEAISAEREPDGSWSAHVAFPEGGAHGVAPTLEAAVADLREAVALVREELGPQAAT